MEKSRIEVQNARLCRRTYALQLHFRGLLWIECPFVRLQLSGAETRYSLPERDRLANERNVYSAITVVDSFIKGGGDEYDEKSVFLSLKILNN